MNCIIHRSLSWDALQHGLYQRISVAVKSPCWTNCNKIYVPPSCCVCDHMSFNVCLSFGTSIEVFRTNASYSQRFECNIVCTHHTPAAKIHTHTHRVRVLFAKREEHTTRRIPAHTELTPWRNVCACVSLRSSHRNTIASRRMSSRWSPQSSHKS